MLQPQFLWEKNKLNSCWNAFFWFFLSCDKNETDILSFYVVLWNLFQSVLKLASWQFLPLVSNNFYVTTLVRTYIYNLLVTRFNRCWMVLHNVALISKPSSTVGHMRSVTQCSMTKSQGVYICNSLWKYMKNNLEGIYFWIQKKDV